MIEAWALYLTLSASGAIGERVEGFPSQRECNVAAYDAALKDVVRKLPPLPWFRVLAEPPDAVTTFDNFNKFISQYRCVVEPGT